MLNKDLVNPTPILNGPFQVSFLPFSLYRGFDPSLSQGRRIFSLVILSMHHFSAHRMMLIKCVWTSVLKTTKEEEKKKKERQTPSVLFSHKNVTTMTS